MTIDPDSDRAVYRQLADLIRRQIDTGRLRPGQRLPAQKDYVQEYGVSRNSVDRAMQVLRREGLIVTSRRGSRVRSRTRRAAVPLEQGKISARIPTETERRKLGIAVGVPVLIIEDAKGAEKIHPADRTVVVVDLN